MYQAVLFHQKPQTANKLELNTFSNLLVTGYVSFFFFMPDRTDLFGLNFCSGHSDVVTAHTESLRTPVQRATQAWFFFVRSSFNCFFFFFYTRKIKNCKQTWQSLNTWGSYVRNIVPAWRFYLIFQFLWNKRFIMIRKTHCKTSPHHFCDVSLPYHFWSWLVLLLRFGLHNIILPLNLQI